MSDRRGKRIERISDEILLERQFRLKNKILRELRALFRQLKHNTGLTQSAIAQRTGMDPAEVSRLLNGQTNMTLATLSDLLEGMGAELEIKAVSIDQIQVLSDERNLSESTATQWSGLAREFKVKFINQAQELEAFEWHNFPTFFTGHFEHPIGAPLISCHSGGEKDRWIFEPVPHTKPSEPAKCGIQIPNLLNVDHL